MRLSNQGKPIEPRHARRERRRWDDADRYPLALGCTGCADLPTCGGLHKAQDTFWCLDECCSKPNECKSVCPRNLAGFVRAQREINGFSLETVPRAAAATSRRVDPYAPYLYHASSRVGSLSAHTVAVPLYALFDSRGGARYHSPEALRAAFRIAGDARIILIGSGEDKGLERWWGWSDKRREAIASLRSVGADLVTGPNFSLFTDQLRYEDLFNIKRIAIAWHEFIDHDVPCALHINARTERDYERFAQFIAERPEVTEVAFEFGTGAGWALRRMFHARHLAELAKFVGRPLRLVMVGGGTVLRYLSHTFADVTYIDTTPFMATMKRKTLVREGLTMHKVAAPTPPGAPVDDLLAHNVAFARSFYETFMPAVPELSTERKSESLATEASVPVVAA